MDDPCYINSVSTVLRVDSREGSECSCSSGELFQRVGALTAKALSSALVFSLDQGILKLSGPHQTSDLMLSQVAPCAISFRVLKVMSKILIPILKQQAYSEGMINSGGI